MLHLSGVCRMPPNFFFFLQNDMVFGIRCRGRGADMGNDAIRAHARRPRKRDARIGRGQYAHIQALFATLLRKFKTQLRKYEGKA